MPEDRQLAEFEIQRGYSGLVQPWMPYTIRVYLPRVPNRCFHCVQCTEIYELPDNESRNWFELRGRPWVPRDDGAHYYICDCLGELKVKKRTRMIVFEKT